MGYLLGIFGLNGIAKTFNSLYGILKYETYRVGIWVENFQFPLWDTSTSDINKMLYNKDFQFPLWDTILKMQSLC